MTNKHREFSEKLFIFPESFHALRIELQTNYPHLWNTPIQYLMWADTAGFIEKMCEALDLVILSYDSANLDGYCKRFIDELRKKRGLPPLHVISDYYPDPLRNSAPSKSEE